MDESINRLGLLCNCTFPQWCSSKQTHSSKIKKSPPTLKHKHTHKQKTETSPLPGSTRCPPANTEQVCNRRLKKDRTFRMFLQIRSIMDDETHPHHIDRAGACCSLAVLLWVAHRLVVVGLVEGVQRGVDQVDHQHRVHLTEELTYLDEQTHRRKQILNREQECLQWQSWSRTITFYHACE